MKNFLKQNWIVAGSAVLVLGALFLLKGGTNNPFDSSALNCSKLVSKNPYPQGTGEYAGFDWSMLDRGSRDCEAWNKPFIAGCIEHIRQEISYNLCISNQSAVEKLKTVKSILVNCEEGQDIEGYCMTGW